MIKQKDLHALVRSRRAIRRYTDEPVARELVEGLLETAVWAPSAHNRQPWRFAVLSDFSAKEKLALAMGTRLRADRTGDGDNAEAIERDVARSYARITGATVAIVVCMSMADMDTYPDKRRQQAERDMAMQSVAMAAQNLWLLAHAEGLGVCWLCAPLFVPKLVCETLELPADWEPMGLLTMGWPAQEREKTREPMETKVRYL
ncbi:MAG: nitroreductase family protein [Chloroflexota bacterium]